MKTNREYTRTEVAGLIDSTLLQPQATLDEHLQLCAEAKEFSVKGVCISTSWLPLVVRELSGTAVLPIAVIGFPAGICSTDVKVYEAKWCEDHGAKELDMVVHLGLLKSGDWSSLRKDLNQTIKSTQLPVKVIFEAHLLSSKELVQLCEVCRDVGASFVKTSTGFGGGGARLSDVELMKEHFAGNVKASGGIRDWSTMKKFLDAGADRIGTSAGISILKELSQ